MELVNNAAFYNWSNESRFEDEDECEGSDCVEDLEREWNQEMIDIFGKPFIDGSPSVEPIRSMDDMRDAIQTTFWYRVGQNLEYPVMFRRRRLDILYIPEDAYEMCSENTQKLARIQADYMTYNCCNDQYINLPPFIKDLSDWIDSKYAPKEESEEEEEEFEFDQ